MAKRRILTLNEDTARGSLAAPLLEVPQAGDEYEFFAGRPIDAGGNAISNVGNVDGRDLSADGTKLDGVEAGATADQTDAEIETAYNNQVAAASQAEAEAGTEVAIRRFSPERIKQAIDALGGGGVTDHGALTGLADDDHTQYTRADGARPFTNIVGYSAHPTFGTDTDIVDKKYVDDEIAAAGGGGGTSDHGELTGLGDDDHPQYLLASGARNIADVIAYSAHPTFNAETQLIDKKYVDDNFAAILNGYVVETLDFTLNATHRGKWVVVDSSVDVIATIPADTTFNAGIGYPVGFIQKGTGKIVFGDDGGAASLLTQDGFALESAGQNAHILAHKYLADTWLIDGGLMVSDPLADYQAQMYDVTTDVVASVTNPGGWLFKVPPSLDGAKIVSARAWVGTAGTTGATEVQLENVTQAVNLLTSPLSIPSGSTSNDSSHSIDTNNDVLTSGDILRANTTAQVSTTAPKGLFVGWSIR